MEAAAKAYIISVDQSTSGTKALLIDRQGTVLCRQSKPHRQYYPQPGWVEHDPIELFSHVCETVQGLLRTAGITAQDVSVLTITNQRETAVVWDPETGLPVYPAIVWQCQRTAEHCAILRRLGAEPIVMEKTGLLLDPYFSAGKFKWIYDHAGLTSGRYMAGTIDSWLIWKLTDGKVHATDHTNASRTSLYNLHTRDWDAELIRLFGVEGLLLPEIRSSTDIYGVVGEAGGVARGIPISGVIGDSQAALFGQLCYEPGMVKATYGTGTSVLMNVGSEPIRSGHGLVTAVAWSIDGQMTYALEGIIRSSGDTLSWLRDQLQLFEDYEAAEELAASLPNNEGVYLVPAFVGLGIPYWDPEARAAIVGMNRGSSKAHIIRAGLESVAYQVRDTIEHMCAESGAKLKELRADGGAVRNRLLMQFQADQLQIDVRCVETAELSAMGSAYLGGLATGYWSSLDELAALPRPTSTYRPQMTKESADRYYKGWQQAVKRVLTQGR